MFKFNNKIQIGDRLLSSGSAVCIVAEAGVNHNGRLPIAMKMIDAAAAAGADFIKFQTFDTEEFMVDSGQVYSYTVDGKKRRERIYEMFKRLELPHSWHRKLFDHCVRKRIRFLSTPCDTGAVDLLLGLGVRALKISSEDLININLLGYAAKKSVPVVLSTGMADESEIDRAVGIFKKNNNKNLVILHCTSLYPVPEGEENLNRMASIADRYGTLVGYSDHTKGFEAAMGAVFMGAVMIEKHFTLSKRMKGPDHAFSLEPHELKELVGMVRRCEKIKGSGALKPSRLEGTERIKHRRSIVASADIARGKIIKEEDLAYKRPGGGLRPIDKYKVIGKRLVSGVKEDGKILLGNLRR